MMRGETEEVGKGQIMEDFVCLNNECTLYPIENTDLLKDFKPQTEIISIAGVWMIV